MENLAGQLIFQARDKSGLSLRAIGRRAGTSHATLGAYIRGEKSPSTRTLERILDACDLAMDVTLRPRVRGRGGLSRGVELEEVLHLADQFPVRAEGKTRPPIFPHG